MNSRCIVSVATTDHYRAMQVVQREACARYSNSDVLFFDALPPDCEEHNPLTGSMYMFKIAAICQATLRGYDTIMWLDATNCPVAPIEELWLRIERVGWYAPRQPKSMLGQWASDAFLAAVDMPRDVAMETPMCLSGCVGISIDQIKGASPILTRWLEQQSRGLWNGPHYNRPGELRPLGDKWQGWCSDDPRCEGHRHDEASLSHVLCTLGLKPVESDYFTWEHPRGFIGRTADVMAGTNVLSTAR
jgi:hypothetical protein